MVETNWIVKLTPHPSFRLKVVCKKGGRIMASLRYQCVSVAGAFCWDCYSPFTCSHTRTLLLELVVADESHKV